MSMFDIIISLRKHMRFIIISIIICALLGYMFGWRAQSYTATMSLQYTHSGAKDGLAPDGTPLDPYEIMNPSVISSALREMDIQTTLSVEDVRNKLSVTEVAQPTTPELQRASAEMGEVYPSFPTEYTISFTYDGTLGTEFGNRMIYNLVKSYDEWFAGKYFKFTDIADYMSAAEIQSMDYLEICEYISTNTVNTVNLLQALAQQAPDFRSVHTGHNFAGLAREFENILKADYEKLYSNTRAGRLTIDGDKLIKLYQSRINELDLLIRRDEADAGAARAAMLVFSPAADDVQAPDGSAQPEQITAAQDSIQIINNYDSATMRGTYDELVHIYAEKSVSASNMKHDRQLYQTIVNDYTNDTVSQAQKNELLNENSAILTNITQTVAQYSLSANDTIRDYNNRLVAQTLKYIMAISVSANISPVMISAVSGAAGAVLGCIGSIFIELFHKALEKRRLAALAAAGQTAAGAVTSRELEDMNQLERAFYEQSTLGFPEFYLLYQPVVDRNSVPFMAETFVRWKSERLGEIAPGEFLPIAEKYRLMDAIGAWTLRAVCRQLHEWERGNLPPQIISINISVQQIQSASFVDTLSSIILETRARANQLCFEISGGGEIENIDYVAQKLIMLKALGSRVAVDRFGDTLSSIRVLYELPIEMVKISVRYVKSLASGTIDPFLLQVIGICKERGIHVGMLGVENREQQDTLLRLGMDFLQGFYYGSPMSADKLMLSFNNTRGGEDKL